MIAKRSAIKTIWILFYAELQHLTRFQLKFLHHFYMQSLENKIV